MMIMLLSREMAVAVLRNAVRLSTAAARHGLSSRAVPLRTGRMLAAVPLLINHNFNSKINICSKSAFAENLNIADILYGVLHKSLFLVDIREPAEIKETGKIGKAINIPMNEIEEAFSLSYVDFEAKYHVTKPSVMSERVVIYCEKGKLDEEVAEKLRNLGFNKVKCFPGGFKEWNDVILGDVVSLEESQPMIEGTRHYWSGF
ncbi:hypothetical protein LSH36_183g02049 [Paralvinella palmiformis]|uniref:Rhodanese domain-containing protein n=1 Tax=Paralvinella palmiformis TaxID=53620 RepID=A0AAD9N719_9ANNE|nr:hypothetical protein LSH36_183g02049 [Paralvinella palmiformis]